MKKNKLNLGLFLVIASAIVLFSVVTVSADVVLQVPSSTVNSTVTAIVTMNATNSSLMDGDGEQMLNCLFYVGSSSTANTTWTLLGNFSNSTASASEIIGTNDTTTLEDANDYQFNATCYFTNGSILSVVNTGITVDNFVPNAPTTLTPTSDADGAFTYSGAVNGSSTTACTLRFRGINPGASSYAMTHSGNLCTYAATSTPEAIYTWVIEASDGTNLTNSSTQQVNVDIKTSSGKKALLEGQQTTTSGTGLSSGLGGNIAGIPIWILVLATVVVVVVVIAKRK